MRNAVIRKKHLKEERAYKDFIRMPARIMVPSIDINCTMTDEHFKAWSDSLGVNRLWPIV